MKKIYILALSMVLGNFFVISATLPQRTSTQISEKKTKTNSLSSEKVLPGNMNMQPSNRGKHQIQPVHIPPTANSTASRAACSFTDNFDGTNDVASLIARGYKSYYRGGGPAGTTAAWHQGDGVGFFPSFNGPINGYVASDFNSVTNTNDINNWLVLPSLNVNMGDVISFYSRAAVPATGVFPDSLHVWYSAAGDSVPEANSWVLLGEFEVNINDIWENKSFPIPASSANGRLAIQYAVADGGPTGPNGFYVGIDQLAVFTPSATDASLSELTAPVSNCLLSSSEPVTVVVNNSGVNPIYGFDVSYALDTNTAVVENVGDTIAPGGTYTYTFTANADLSAFGSHSLNVSVIVANDSNGCNNQNTFIVNNNPLNNPLTSAYTMGFEANENLDNWLSEDADADGVTWQTINADPHSGLICMRKAGSGQDDDDWLYSGCLDLASGNSYTLDYWYKIFDVATACNIETYLADGQASVMVNQLIIQDPIPADTIYHHSISTFTVQNSGTYYLAFHAYSLAGTGTSSIRLDDINLDDGTSIGIAEYKVDHNVSVYPNPNSGVFYLSSHNTYKNVSVDVFNITGQNVYSSKNNDLNQQRIDLSEQANGVYTIRISSDTFVENHTIEINK